MLRYVARRLLQMVPVFFGATLLIYAMVFALPGDPVAALGGQRSLSPEVIDQIKASYHLDKPFIVQYLLYLKGLLTLDLGQSLRGTESVLDVLVRAYPITIKLSLMALTFEAVAGISVRRGINIINTGHTLHIDEYGNVQDKTRQRSGVRRRCDVRRAVLKEILVDGPSFRAPEK